MLIDSYIGLNIGLGDAVNLAWKLAGKVKGYFIDQVLDTYNGERRPIAQKIITDDKLTSVLTEGRIPVELQDDPEKNAHKLLIRMHIRNQGFNSGLGVAYPEDGLINATSSESLALIVHLGARAPDVLIQRPGIQIPIRLYSVTKAYGKFTILVFCGSPSSTEGLLLKWKDYLEGAESITNYHADTISVLSLLVNDNHSGAAEENLRIPRHGQILYDAGGAAHERYGVDEDKGAVLVLRPDGLLGTACGLDEGPMLSSYFRRLMKAQKDESQTQESDEEGRTSKTSKGEIEIH